MRLLMLLEPGSATIAFGVLRGRKRERLHYFGRRASQARRAWLACSNSSAIAPASPADINARAAASASA
jgi:hypothetical protein